MDARVPTYLEGIVMVRQRLKAACRVALGAGLLVGLLIADAAVAVPVLLSAAQDPGHVSILVDAPDSARAIVLIAPLGDGHATVKDGAQFANEKLPLVRDRQRLASLGIGVAVFDLPKTTDTLRISDRESRSHLALLDAGAQLLKSHYGTSRIVLGGVGSGAESALAWLAGHSGASFDSVVFVSGHFADFRGLTSAATLPVLIIHPASASCPPGSLLEAREVSAVLKSQLVMVYDRHWTTNLNCVLDQPFGLPTHNDVIAEAIDGWLNGQNVTGISGDDSNGPTWHERVVLVEMPDEYGGGRLESTVYYPDPQRAGPGPYPLMVFHHGDVPDGAEYSERKRRLAELPVAHAFLDMGYVVAVPERPGIGKSDGRYDFSFKQDIDPTMKGRVHGVYALYTTGLIRTLPEIDGQRVLVSGQSAGGYAVLAVAAANPPWLRGVIDFSGGATNLRMSEAKMGGVAEGGNAQMVAGFAKFGSQARVPVEMVFTANDSRYSAATIRSSVDAWVAAGGTAHLDLYPPIPGDGHFVYHRPDLWLSDVRTFLKSINMPSDELPAAKN